MSSTSLEFGYMSSVVDGSVADCLCDYRSTSKLEVKTMSRLG
jgi:hypothetical protein